MNLVRPNKAVKYMTDGKRIWILYSPNTGWEQTIMAEINKESRKVIYIVDGRNMRDREKIIRVEIYINPRVISADVMDIGIVTEAYRALEDVAEGSRHYSLTQALLSHCNSDNILIDTTTLDSDFDNPPGGEEISDLLDVFRRTNLKGATPQECICGVCCDLDNQCRHLEDSGLINSETPFKAVGIICTSFDEAVRATQNLKKRGYDVAPVGDYPDRHRNFITYIMRTNKAALR